MDGDPPPEPRPFRVERIDYEGGLATLRFEGELDFPVASRVWSEVRELLLPAPRRLAFDLGKVTRIDGGTMALLVELQCQTQAQGIEVRVEGARGTVGELHRLYRGDAAPCLRPPPGRLPLLEQIGAVTAGLLDEARGALSFVGELVLALVGAVRNPRSVRWRDVPHLMEQAGADGLPIVVLINFLIGFIMAFQGAIQLKQFGANIYVADLVGLSITRELGPLMTAIIVCGRSGAAFAAALGTMKVSEEVDALRTLGFDPLRYLVVPRMVALMLVLPLLTLVADFVALLGGVLVGISWLDLTVVAYVNETVLRVGLWDVYSGVVKSVVFALAVALIACQQGLATSGGAEGVGRRTTSSVVTILFSLIVIDALFTILFYVFDA